VNEVLAYERTADAIEKALKPHISDKGYDWEFHVDETEGAVGEGQQTNCVERRLLRSCIELGHILVLKNRMHRTLCPGLSGNWTVPPMLEIVFTVLIEYIFEFIRCVN
jgi:hypothetical protein